LEYYGYYDAVQMTSRYVCQNESSPAECRPKILSTMMGYALDTLMDKDSRVFCTEVLDKKASASANKRPRPCNWCRGAVAAFQAALAGRGKEGALNLTGPFCAETEAIAPEFLESCPAVVEGFWQPHAGSAVSQRDAVCRAVCKPTHGDDV
jgi:hypothetical protein